MLDVSDLVDFDVIQAYIKYAVLVIAKMMLMSVTTAFFRMKNKAFSNPEDVASFGKEAGKKYLKTDPDVERVRRIHLNDLENIIPFLFVGFFYAFSGAGLSTALLHYRIFLGSRIFHTFAYLIPLPQPCRGLAWLTGYLVTWSMVYKILTVAFTMM